MPDPLLSPARIGEALGGSRSDFCRAFAGKRESVAAAIWRPLCEQALAD